MKNIINMIITGLIIAVGAYIFPEYIVCMDDRAFVMAVLVILGIGLVIDNVFVWAVSVILMTDRAKLAIPTCMVLIVASKLIALMAADMFVPGFDIVGKGTYTVLVILMMIIRYDRSEGK